MNRWPRHMVTASPSVRSARSGRSEALQITLAIRTALDPPRDARGQTIQGHGDAVLRSEAVLRDLELQDADRPEHRIALEPFAIDKELDHPLLRELLQPLLELLAPHRVGEPDADEVLGAEARDARELPLARLAERVSDAEHAGIPDADHVSREGLLD